MSPRIFRRYGGAVSLVLILLTALPAAAQSPSPWQVHALPGRDLAKAPLDLDQRWNGGLLRVRLKSATALPVHWHITLDYGEGQRVELDPATAAGRLVGAPEPNEVTLDLPVLAPRRLRVEIEPRDLRLPVIAVLYPSRLQSQQMIGRNPQIDLFDAGLTAQEQEAGPGFGRLDLLAARGELIGTCTGFRVAQGYWLTAAHCVARDAEDPDRAPVAAIRLQPLDYAGSEGARLWRAVPVATGQAAGRPDPTTSLGDADLDYAVLRVEEDPGGPAFPLASGVAVRPGMPLQLFQHWTGSLPPAAGKARSADAECMLYPRIGANDPRRPELCPDALQHGCSSEPGASGGPLVERATLRLVGLHYRGGLPRLFNCALPAMTIARHICDHQPDIARRITSCS